jgi:hypothetical protein
MGVLRVLVIGNSSLYFPDQRHDPALGGDLTLINLILWAGNLFLLLGSKQYIWTG